MEAQFINELEAAAAIIMAAPNVVSNDQRQSAEVIFLSFRKSKSPFNICRQILETSHLPYVLFEAAETLKESLIREWRSLEETYTTSMRNYLSRYVTQRELPGFVLDRLLQVIAIMVKRGGVCDFGLERTNILNEVENLILSADHPKKLIGCKIILNMMHEYASTVRSTDVGLPWEDHLKAKELFEASDLKRIFQFSVRMLSEIVNSDPPYDESMTILLRHLLLIVEGVLTWGFTNFTTPLLYKRLIASYESMFECDQAPNLRLSGSWRSIIFDPPHVVPLLFRVYWKVRETDQCAHHALANLVQLASVNGTIFQAQDLSKQYLEMYMENFLRLVSSVNIKSKESIGISNIVRKIHLFHAPQLWKLSMVMQESYLDEITRLTCSFIEGTAAEDGETDDVYYADALSNMLEAWSSFLHDYKSLDSTYLTKEIISQCALRVYTTYLQCHLAPPDGKRRFQGDPAEVEDREDSDRIQYHDQLQTIGALGRQVCHESFPMLYQVIEERSGKLRGHLQAMQSHTMTINDAASLDNIFEDLHWSILIAGHTLCMESVGETPLIPSDVMSYSMMRNSRETDLESSIAILCSVCEVPNLSDVDSGSVGRCDQMVRILADVMRLCVMETSAGAEVRLRHFLSPELGSTMMWFLNRICTSYLVPTEAYYSEINPIFLGVMGKDTAGSKFILNFILEKVQTNIMHFSSEPILLKDTMELFSDLTAMKDICKYMVESSAIWQLARIQANVAAGSLPEKVRLGLYKAFTLAGNGLDKDSGDRTLYFDQIVLPPVQAFRQLVSQENFNRMYQEESIRGQVVDILEALTGVAKGSTINTAELLFTSYLSPILAEIPAFLVLYRNYQIIVQLCLSFFCQAAKYNFCYLRRQSSFHFYDYTANLVRVFAKCNENRFSAEAMADEESGLQELELIMDLLTYIMSKDCLDLADDAFLIDNVMSPPSVAAADISLLGLEFVMPLMTIDLLKYPHLCTQYYKLLVMINDIFPEKVCGLSQTMLAQMLGSIELALTYFGTDVVQAALDFIHGLVSYLYRAGSGIQETACYIAAQRFLPLLFRLTLEHQINTDMLEATSSAVYALISCYRRSYDALVSEQIESHRVRDSAIADRLQEEFTKLTSGIRFTCDRAGKIKFRAPFKTFVLNVQAFLMLK